MESWVGVEQFQYNLGSFGVQSIFRDTNPWFKILLCTYGFLQFLFGACVCVHNFASSL
jgi:hypothetical protein